MKYFIDFEFLEGDVPCRIKGFNIPKWLIKPNNTIQPISVGLVSSDGKEYYAISKDFNLKEAWNRYDIKQEWYSIDESNQSTRDVKIYWIRDNVLLPIYLDKVHGDMRNHVPFSYSTMKGILKRFGKTNKQIAEEVKWFIYHTGWEGDPPIHAHKLKKQGDIQFYGYYSDYDWVVFCWLFDRMIDLPRGFPMYCIDLKQILDDKVMKVYISDGKQIQSQIDGLDNRIEWLRTLPSYPKIIDEHNALADAKWNKQLYEFLIKL